MDLLSEPGRARRKWTAQTSGRAPAKPSFAAIARILAEYLWDEGAEPESKTNLPRELRHKVRRALTGKNMTRSTLVDLMAAFDLAPSDRERLLDAFDAPDRLTDTVSGSSDDEGLPVRSRHRTMSISEHHYLGPDRCPTRHVTSQVLQATTEGLSSYLYMFDTNTIAVTPRQGIRGVGPIKPIATGVFGVDIELFGPLSVGDTTPVSYESTFSYSCPPEPNFRRAAFEGVQSLDIRVQFDPGAVPLGVDFAEWDQLSHNKPTRREAVRIEEDLSVHRYLRSVDNSIVGFVWQWDVV